MVSSISGVNSRFTTAVPAISFACNQLSEDLIKRLKELGIDPTKVSSNAEAKNLQKMVHDLQSYISNYTSGFEDSNSMNMYKNGQNFT